MKKEHIEEVEKLYNVKIKFIDKIKNVHKIYTEDKIFCIKTSNYDIMRFKFILNGIMYLSKNGCKEVLKPIKNNKNSYYCKIENKYSFLTEWVDGKHADYNDYSDIINSSKALGRLHKAGIGYGNVSNYKKEINYGKLIYNFKMKKKQLENFKIIIQNKNKKTYFDELYIIKIEENIISIEKSIEMLKCDYYKIRFRKDKIKGTFCHHDMANHNVIITKAEVKIIDFDYMILESPLHDLSSLIIRSLKDGRWSVSKANIILQSYSEISPINKDDIKLIAGIIKFPQDFWQIGLQYYIEKQPWEEEKFVKKLNKYIEDKYIKDKFITDFYNYNFYI